ncbi:MAG: hypothetical protein LBV44_05445 [Methylobacillus sp.]|nr:hypothetical protein [Methylobacillus sp.]
MKHIIAALIFAFCFAAPVCAQAEPDVIEQTLKEITAENLPAIRKAAEQGDAEAQFKLGIAYLDGGVIEKDGKQGFDWMTKAANQNHAAAQFFLGIFYAYGGDEAQSIAWMRKSAAQGFLPAQQVISEYDKEQATDKNKPQE